MEIITPLRQSQMRRPESTTPQFAKAKRLKKEYIKNVERVDFIHSQLEANYNIRKQIPLKYKINYSIFFFFFIHNMTLVRLSYALS